MAVPLVPARSAAGTAAETPHQPEPDDGGDDHRAHERARGQPRGIRVAPGRLALDADEVDRADVLHQDHAERGPHRLVEGLHAVAERHVGMG